VNGPALVYFMPELVVPSWYHTSPYNIQVGSKSK
jgi:hypothetical protein